MSLSIAIVTFLTALVPLLFWLIKRFWGVSSKEEKDAELEKSVQDFLEEMEMLRRSGNDAGADALLRRLRLNGLSAADSGSNGRECSDNNLAKGNSDTAAECRASSSDAGTLHQ